MSTRSRYTPNPLCTQQACADDENGDCLTCSNCNRMVHYICTRLPPYMISAFKDGRRLNCKYVCTNCVQISKDIQDIPNPGPQPSIRQAAELSKLKTIVKEKEETIDKLKNNEQHLLEIVETQKNELTVLKKQLKNDPAFHTVEYVETKLEKKLEDFRTQILSTIKEECTKSYAAAASADSQIVSSNDDIKIAVKEVHKEEAAEEKDKLKRSKNIIVHGVEEFTDDQPKKDEEWVKTLTQNLHAKVKIKHMTRLGAKVADKKRPLLVSFDKEEEKESIFGNLHVLKGVNMYKGISICEDLTPDQRKEFKNLVIEAKRKNESETGGIWRVRGSSKNGFRLKKVNNQRQD